VNIHGKYNYRFQCNRMVSIQVRCVELKCWHRACCAILLRACICYRTHL